MNQKNTARLDKAVKWLILLGFLSLPYTHLKFMPDLGTTRPLSTVFFALAFGLIVLQGAQENRLNPRRWLGWLRGWEHGRLLRWWVWLIGLGILSAAITPLYGVPIQALIRLVGYLAIFITLFIGFYSLPRYGIQKIARWTAWGYLPALAYALVEALAVLDVPWAVQFILGFRDQFLFPFHWISRMALLTTEPSFAGFQILLLALLLPYVPERWLRWCGWALVALVLVFTTSGTLLVMVGVYLGFWLLFSLRRRGLVRLIAGTAGLGAAAFTAYALVPRVQQRLASLLEIVLSSHRLTYMNISF